MIKPYFIVISVSKKCTARCDFCSLRMVHNKTYPKHVYLPLIMGSLFENSFRDIFKWRWKENEFLRKLRRCSPFGIYEKYLALIEKDLTDVKNYHPCYGCYMMRNDKEFIESFNFRKDYRLNEQISVKRLEDALSDAADIGIKNVHFSGEGEPFLEFEKMKKLIAFSKGMFKNISINTNASFAKNEKTTLRKMKILKECGLDEIMISYDFNRKYKFHQSFIPQKNVAILSKVAQRLGIATNFSCAILKGTNPEDKLKDIEKLTGKKLKLLSDKISFSDEIMSLFKNLSFVNKMYKENVVRTPYVKMDAAVQRNINEEDLQYYKPFKSKLALKTYVSVKKITTRHYGYCATPVILTNGLVVQCCSAW